MQLIRNITKRKKQGKPCFNVQNVVTRPMRYAKQGTENPVIDYAKFKVDNMDPKQLEHNRLLCWETTINTTTGELARYKNAFYKGLEFKIYEATTAHPKSRITVDGSLHCYWNNGGHNYNDFGLVEVLLVIEDLRRKFTLKPENMIFSQCEIGVNITPPISSEYILKNCLIHKTKELSRQFTHNEGYYKIAQHQRYRAKLYDKASHYRSKGFKPSGETLRLEKSFNKMRDMNARGIYSLQDLMQYGLHNFTPDLVQLWDNIILSDPALLDGTDQEYTYSNVNYWLKLNNRQFRYNRDKLNKLHESNLENLRPQIRKLIIEKCTALTKQIGRINPLSIWLIPTIEDRAKRDRTCVVTGINIAMQKPDSFHLSHTGIKYYRDTDRKIYNELRRKYLSAKWHSHPAQVQVKELAHNIRNTWNNRRRREIKKYQSQQITIQEFINQNQLQ